MVACLLASVDPGVWPGARYLLSLTMEKFRLLVIDGDPQVHQMVHEVLRDSCEVHAAASVQEALAQVRALRLSLILLAVQLPDHDGFAVFEALKSEPDSRAVQVVFLDAQPSQAHEIQALDLGALDYLAKPLHPRLLLRRISNLMGREMLRKELERRESEWRVTLNAIPDLMFKVDIDGTYLHVFANQPQLLARSRQQMLGRTVNEVLPPAAAAVVMQAIEEADTQGTSYGREFELDLPDGVHWFELSVARSVPVPERPAHFVILSREVTARKLSDQQLQHLALHDPLTDLPNRAFFMRMAEKAMASAQRSGGRLALGFVDLDHFKPINDLYGHAMGDRVLQQVAARMQSVLRRTDCVGRVGGDEFMLLLAEVGTHEAALGVAEKLRQALLEPFAIDGKAMFISSCIGLAFYPDHGQSLHDICRQADHAMYLAKQAGRNCVRLYEPAATLVDGFVALTPRA